MSYNPLPVTFEASAQPHFDLDFAASVEAHSRPSVGQELASWLSALPHYFDLKNHPLGDAGGIHLVERNYIDETHILNQVLRRCLQLCHTTDVDDYAGHLSGEGDVLGVSTDAGEAACRAPDASFASTWTRLSEMYVASRALTEARQIDLRTWSSLGFLLRREFNAGGAQNLFRRDVLGRNSLPQLTEWRSLSESASAHDSADDVYSILSSFAYCLDQLNLIGEWLTFDRPLKMTLPIFTHVHGQARATVTTLERMALDAAAAGTEFYEVFDSAGYAVGMELNKVFSHELVGLAASRHPPAIYTKVENSHGLLRDCFQQTILSLAQAFDPALDRTKVFDSLDAKLEQSLTLRSEIWALSELIRHVERDHNPLAPLVARLQTFQQGAMRYLMYKDWESFERFVAEISAARGAAELGPVLHRFATYLDALFNQINMRAVLADHPFEYPPIVV